MLIAFAGCRPSDDSAPVRVVDLIRELDRAERRPPTGFALGTHVADGVARPAIVVPVPSRATWSFPLPRRGAFRGFLALETSTPAAAVRFRVGVSDHRIYEGLAEYTLTASRRGWIAVGADLSAYAGFKWSLFYRPDRITWRIVLAADDVGGGGSVAVWGSPEIVTDHRSALEYVTRRHELRSRLEER